MLDNLKKKNNNRDNKNNIVISPINTKSPFSIPNSPEFISVDTIKNIKNIYLLERLEQEYDNFLENKCQILLLLDLIDEVFDIRNSLTIQINYLERNINKRLMIRNI